MPIVIEIVKITVGEELKIRIFPDSVHSEVNWNIIHFDLKHLDASSLKNI